MIARFVGADDMKSCRSGYRYLKWSVIPTYCGPPR